MAFTNNARTSMRWLAAAALSLAACGGSATSLPRDASGLGGTGGAIVGGGGGIGTGGADGGAAGAGAGAGGQSGGTGGDNGRSDGGDGGGVGDAAAAVRDAAGDARTPAVDRDATLAIMRRVADYELTRFGTATNTNWVRAVFYTGLLATYGATGDAKYLTATQTWGTTNAWRLGTDSGTSLPAGTPIPAQRWADNHACVQTFADLYLMNPVASNDVMLASGRAAFDQMVAAPLAGRVEWWWEDSLFMAPPALARAAQATPAKAAQYLALLHTMWWDTKAFLYNDAQQLFWRDSTFLNTSTFWSRGNGWVVAGMARLLDALPSTDTRRGDYEALLRLMAAKLKTIQAADGFWRSDLLNPDAFPMPESSGTAFFCYGLAWGINHGVLDRATYLDTVLRAWTALGSVVSTAGRLGWVQAVGARPGPSNLADTNDYATGAFLLAGNELLKL